MSSHIKTAYEYGVAEALKQAGYSSVAEFEKDAASMPFSALPAPTAAEVAKMVIPAAAWGSLVGAARAGEDHRLEGALKGGLGGALGGTVGGFAGRYLGEHALPMEPVPDHISDAFSTLSPSQRHGIDHANLGKAMGAIRGIVPGYLLGTNIGGYLGGGMAQEEPSKLDKLRSRLGLGS